MAIKYSENLLSKVISASYAKEWNLAVLEWTICDWEEDITAQHSCLCGKEKIRYLFYIENNITREKLGPIGSRCIKKFERNDLTDLIVIFEKLYKLKSALSKNEFITLSSDYFTKKLIKFLYDKRVFDSEYNDFDGKDDYLFFLKMFNKRKKNEITENQKKKINAIIYCQIIPYLNKLLNKEIDVTL